MREWLALSDEQQRRTTLEQAQIKSNIITGLYLR